FFLALDTVTSPRNRFQALGIDLVSAVNALSEGSLAYSIERALHHLQRLSLVAALVEEKFFRVGTGRAIGDVLRRAEVNRSIGVRGPVVQDVVRAAGARLANLS